MILIKDRHGNNASKGLFTLLGKYDTYKGSTLNSSENISL